MAKAAQSPDLATLVQRIQCMESDLKGLTPRQVAALHRFKHKLVAGFYELYMQVPEKVANGVLTKAATDTLAILNTKA